MILRQPGTERRVAVLPSCDGLDVRGSGPYPHLELRRQNNRLRPISPRRVGEFRIEGSLDLLDRLLLSAAALVIEHEESVLVSFRQVGQESNTATSTGGVMLRMHKNVHPYRADIERLRSGEQSLQRVFHVLVCGQDYQILLHSRIPDASNVPRSTSPCHCRRSGCSEPRTMSVDPVSSLAKHRTSSRPAAFSTTGEWVASSI